jgi:hypothetical protein
MTRWTRLLFICLLLEPMYYHSTNALNRRVTAVAFSSEANEKTVDQKARASLILLS